MPIFISQGRYSQDAIRGMVKTPEDRAEAVSKLIEAAGGRLLSYYVTFGEYDWLLVTEAPDPGSERCERSNAQYGRVSVRGDCATCGCSVPA